MPKSLYDLIFLQNLIDNKVEENLNLDYKAAASLAKTDKSTMEISKDIAAFANSAGGMIIYGLAEDIQKRHFPGHIDPVNRKTISKEWLETIIQTKIKPRIGDIIIYPIVIDDVQDTVVYIVEIPKSYTAHQSEDKRYYKRFNFNSIPMEDYEIRDVFNRVQDPVVDIEFEQVTLYGVTPRYVIHVFAKNNGHVLANHINCTLSIPANCLENADYHKGGIQVITEELTNSLQNMEHGIFFTPPLLPSRRMHLKEIFIHPFSFDRQNELTYTVYADNMIPKTQNIRIKDILNISSYQFKK